MIRILCTLLIAANLLLALGDDARAQLDQSIANTVSASGVTSVSVAVVENGSLTYAKAFGEANLAQHRAATTETRYAVGSISKQFTAAAILLAQEHHKLSIDDKVGKYFPALTRANEVTIRQLLSHTSGYEDYAPQDYIIPAWTKPTTAQAIMDNWGKKPLNFDPGTKWQYSNTNYVIAGAILEKATGQNLVDYLQEHFFKPLNMTSAGDWVRPAATTDVDASAYTRFALGPPRPVAREGAGWYFAAGELSMTPSDLAKWDVAVLQKKLLSAKSYAEFEKEVKLKNGEATHYALGLSLGEQLGTPTISHSGEVSGFLASNVLFPEKHTAIIVLTNEDGVNVFSAVSRQIAQIVLNAVDARQDEVVRQVLEGLQQGEVNHQLFTDDANAYFSDTAIGDYKTSLAPLGKLVLLNRQSDQQRGGMTHLSYRANFEKDSVSLNIYLMPDGKIEQFLVEQQF